MVCITPVHCEQHISLSFALLFALFHTHQIDGIAMRAFVDLDTEIIENYWGCILRQKVSIKLSVQVNFYLTKIRAEPYKIIKNLVSSLYLVI